MARERVLVIDDDEQILKAIRMFLRHEGLEATCCATGTDGLAAADAGTFDLVLLDLDLPDLDGFGVLERLRSRGDTTPVMVISGHDEEYNKLICLGGGADDYVTKPFSLPLLISKARALMRRNSLYAAGTRTATSSGGDRVTCGPFTLERDACRVLKDGEPLSLTARELALLTLFLSHPGQVFSKAQLYERVWDNPVVDENTVMVYVKRLRDKIETDPSHPTYLQTLRGIGYRFCA